MTWSNSVTRTVFCVSDATPFKLISTLVVQQILSDYTKTNYVILLFDMTTTSKRYPPM